MHQRKSKFDSVTLLRATSTSKYYVEDVIDRATKISTDVDKKQRLKRQLCKACYYVSRVAGQAMTSRECACCEKEQTYSSTDTDALCLGCAKEHSLCKRCSGDLELRVRRRKWP
jgi:hypothetical protein